MTENLFQRVLKPYAEPITSRELRIDATYFFVHFIDDDMLIPTIQTVVFVGENLEPDDKEQVYFQDIDSYSRGVRYGGDGEYAIFQKGSKNELGHVFTFERALDVLLACSIRRQRMPSQRSEGDG